MALDSLFVDARNKCSSYGKFLSCWPSRVYNSTMSRPHELEGFHAGTAVVQIHTSPTDLGMAAAERAARLITSAIDEHGKARIIAATGNSQIPLVEALIKQHIDWKAVEIFHMDEYAGINADHPSSFRYWIRTRLEEKVHPMKTHYLRGDAADLDAEIKRYSELLDRAPIDAAFVGFGENGHIAFNDPPVADFHDPVLIKKVTLDEACRRQQAGEGHFKDVASVPREAITITCPGLFRAKAWVCCVPEARKAEAVQNALEGPISETCPASLVRRHPNAYVFLDRESASLLSAVSQPGSSKVRQSV
jgi:glucosamine-6-phosphate deaminase